MRQKFLTSILVTAFMLQGVLGAQTPADSLRPLAHIEKRKNADLDRIREQQRIEVKWLMDYRDKYPVYADDEALLRAIQLGYLDAVVEGQYYRVLLDSIQLVDLWKYDEIDRIAWRRATPPNVLEAWETLISNPKIRERIAKRGYDPNKALPIAYLVVASKGMLEEISGAWHKELVRLAEDGWIPPDAVESCKLFISSVVRSLEYQEYLRQQTNLPAAEISAHTAGIAFDIPKQWLTANKPHHARALERVLWDFKADGKINYLDERDTGCWHVAFNPGYAPEEDAKRRLLEEQPILPPEKRKLGMLDFLALSGARTRYEVTRDLAIRMLREERETVNRQLEEIQKWLSVMDSQI